MREIKQSIVGNRVVDISLPVQQHVERHGLHVVREYRPWCWPPDA